MKQVCPIIIALNDPSDAPGFVLVMAALMAITGWVVAQLAQAGVVTRQHDR